MPETPYRGLMPYSEEDAPFFFGREAERKIITANLMASRLTVLYGASGVGKSSVLRAGVVHRLRKRARQNLARYASPEFAVVVFSSWRDDPVLGLQDRIEDAIVQTWEGQTFEPAPSSCTLTETLETWLGRTGGELFIILDQFEEYLLYHPWENGKGTFAAELPRAVNHPDLRVNFLVAIREDSLAKLDRFKGRIPNLFDNYLRIEHLDREAGRAAIEKPVEEFNRLHAEEQPIEVEPALVEAVLDQVATGQLVLGEMGRGTVGQGRAPETGQIETPYLQLVMTRLWDEEMRAGSRVLRLETLRRLGGADLIVRRHLDAAMSVLPSDEQEVAARVFYHLVTPSGTKIAHSLSDLAKFAELPQDRVTPVLDKLSAPETRILRPVAPPPDQPDVRRFEIFHDVLASAILDWRARYARAQERAEAERQLAREQRRVLRLRLGVIGLSLLLVMMVALAVFANQKRNEATRAQKQAEAQLAVSQSRQVAALGRSRLNSGQSQQALLLGIAATGEITETAEATNLLRDALEAWRGEAVLSGHTERVFGVEFSPNGQYLASVSDDDTARIWQLDGEHRYIVLRGHTDDLTDVVFTPDSRLLLTASRDDTTRIWDVPTGRLVRTLEQSDDVVTLAVSPDGKTVAAGGEDRLIWLWDVETGRPILSEPLQTEGAAWGVDFSSDGRFLAAASSGRTAWLWQMPSGEFVDHLTGHEGPVRTVAFSPDSRYVATLSDDTVRVWDVMNDLTPIELRRPQHGAAILSLAFSPDGNYLATASQDTTARIWDLRRLNADPVVLTGHTETVLGVQFSPDGKFLATTSWDETARLWRVRDGALETVLTGHAGEVWAPAFSPDGRLLATPDQGGTVHLWRVQAGGDIGRYSTRSIPASDVALVRDQVAVVEEDGIIELWDPQTQAVQSYTVGASRLGAAAVSADSSWAAVGGADGRITILNTSAGAIEDSWFAHANGVRALLFLPDGVHLASAGGDAVIRLWDLRTGQPEGELRGHQNDVNGLVLGADPETLISASGDGTVRLWNWQTAEEHNKLNAQEPLLTLAIGPDRRHLAAGGYGAAVRVWDLASLDKEPIVLPHEGYVRTLGFSNSTGWLASGDENGAIRLWDLDRPEATTFNAYGTRRVSGLTFDSTGDVLFSVTGDGALQAWPVQTSAVLTLACQRAGRNLSRDEWNRFLSFIEFAEVCDNLESVQWLEGPELDLPQPEQLPEFSSVDGQPVIYYFEAVPGATLRPGESITLQWHVEGVKAVYLEYGGERHGVTSPNEEVFSPTQDTTYRLVAVNDRGERTAELTVFVEQD